MTKKTAICAAVAMGFAAAGANASEQEGWQFELTPYFWAANVDADITAGGEKGTIDSDLMDNLDTGFMGMGVISYNRFVLYLDNSYISVSDDAKTERGVLVPVGTKVKGEADLNFATLGIGWRFDTWGEDNTIDVLIGARNTSLDLELKSGGQKISRDDDITDPLLMLRPSVQISENWRFNPTISVGVGGDSDSHYELMPQFQYSFADNFALRFGYKRVYYDVNSGSKGTSNYRVFDGSFSGPFIGLGWMWPAKAKPAPTPAPVAVVPPPAPVKCSDKDNDGVCDNTDQCPNTPPGKRVGPMGCDCDYTLTTTFAFDSAELSDADKAELDRLAEILANPKLSFVAASVDGYTDSVGSDKYNEKLSQRRAQAVVDYLKAKGVSMIDNVTVRGLGEADPVADNSTEDGRAQNRRVVLRRTDCSK